jgi:hypothetical protein
MNLHVLADIVSGVQSALQSLFGMSSYVAALAFSDLSAFPWLMLASCTVVVAGAHVLMMRPPSSIMDRWTCIGMHGGRRHGQSSSLSSVGMVPCAAAVVFTTYQRPSAVPHGRANKEQSASSDPESQDASSEEGDHLLPS